VKAFETPQGMKRKDSLAWSGLGGHVGRSSGSGQGPTLGMGGQRELLNLEILWGLKGVVALGQRIASW